MKKIALLLLPLFVLAACGEETVVMSFVDSSTVDKNSNPDLVGDSCSETLTLVPDYDNSTLEVTFYGGGCEGPEDIGEIGQNFFTRFEEIRSAVKEKATGGAETGGFVVELFENDVEYTVDGTGFRDFYDQLIGVLTEEEQV
ncbi:hypothetical protein HYW82_03930 [Candidatus Peregrinibacteria bacterium]|nr:hypothetical protein [Candidatus Peregrinibacteria bacterium]